MMGHRYYPTEFVNKLVYVPFVVLSMRSKSKILLYISLNQVDINYKTVFQEMEGCFLGPSNYTGFYGYFQITTVNFHKV